MTDPPAPPALTGTPATPTSRLHHIRAHQHLAQLLQLVLILGPPCRAEHLDAQLAEALLLRLAQVLEQWEESRQQASQEQASRAARYIVIGPAAK